MYLRILRTLLDRGIVTTSSSVLVVCGGASDKEYFQELGFKDVTISNLDSRMNAHEFLPYKWSYQDAESLQFPDNSFDLVFVSAGLHHCYSPHRALLEIYRVARRCAVAIEAQDGLLTRIAARLGLVDEYEITAVVGNDLKFGGVRNSSVPNYIYRWTTREVTKTIAAYAPYAKPRVLWFREFEPPLIVLQQRKRSAAYLFFRLVYPAIWLITKVVKSQCNLFGFAVLKPDLSREQFPWLKLEDGKPVINKEWVGERFKRVTK